METRIAALSIIVTDMESVEELNSILHDYGPSIIGRMGLPYREKDMNIIFVAIDATLDDINALTGKLGRLSGVNAKATYV